MTILSFVFAQKSCILNMGSGAPPATFTSRKSNQEENRGRGRPYIEFLVVVGLFLCAIPGDLKAAQSYPPLRVCKQITLELITFLFKLAVVDYSLHHCLSSSTYQDIAFGISVSLNPMHASPIKTNVVTQVH